MKLLLTNDDGINAKGLHALARELEKNHELVIAAPNSQRSACGHSITIHEPLYVKEVKIDGIKSKAYSVSGTPADCVRVALDKLMDRKVDMVISGINNGYNLGTDVIYSGTVSAAIEAAIYKIPSMAVSTDITEEVEKYEIAASYASRILSIAKDKYNKDDVVLNLNVPLVPVEEIKGIKVCRVGGKTYDNYFIEKLGENDDRIYELKGKLNEPNNEETDVHYIKEGYVTLTPLHYDLTNFNILNEVGKIFNKQ